MRDWVKKIMGRSVADLAAEVDKALGRLAQAQGLEQECMDALRLAQNDVKKAEADVAAARDALFEAHPRLVQNYPQQMAREAADSYLKINEGQDMSNHQHDPAWDPTPIEVDDDNDPRFAGGAPAPSASDTEPLPPIVWEEHDE